MRTKKVFKPKIKNQIYVILGLFVGGMCVHLNTIK